MTRRWLFRTFWSIAVASSVWSQGAGGLAGTTTPINYNPIAIPQIVQLAHLSSVTLTLGSLDTEGHAVTYTLVSGPSLGSLGKLNPTTGQVVYTASAEVSANDSFVFLVSDGILQSDTATVTILSPLVPILGLAETTGGEFTQGQPDALYSIVVSNSPLGSATMGVVSVTNLLPSVLSLVSMTGNGWTCISNICSRSDALNPGSSYPLISVLVNVSGSAPAAVTNQAIVSGGGAAGVTINSTVVILQFTCDINGDGSTTVNDIQLVTNEALGMSAAVNDVTHDGVVSVVDIQKVVNAVLGLGCPY
jgi:Bacterial Ig domain